MKRSSFALLPLLILLLSGCAMAQNAGSGVSQSTVSDDASFSENTIYRSNISPADCCLCGNGMENRALSPWGQNNIALISFNTFEIQPIEINRYDSGQLLEEFAGFGSIECHASVEGGFSASLAENHDRRYATGSVCFHEDEILEPGRAADFLCEDCFNKILPCRDGRYFGVGAVNLATREARLFAENLGGFTLGDFYIHCDLQEKDGDPLRIDVLIFCCPIWYEKES